MADYQLNREIQKGWRFANDIPLTKETKLLFEQGSVMHYMCGNIREAQFGLITIAKADVMTNLLDVMEKQGDQINKLKSVMTGMSQPHTNGVTNGTTNVETSV